MVRALISDQCVAGLIPRLESLSLLVLYCALKGVPQGTLVFHSLQKPMFDLIRFKCTTVQFVPQRQKT